MHEITIKKTEKFGQYVVWQQIRGTEALMDTGVSLVGTAADQCQAQQGREGHSAEATSTAAPSDALHLSGYGWMKRPPI